jgi:hypothetical protein
MVILALTVTVSGTKAETMEGKLGDITLRLGGQYRVMFNGSNFDWHASSISGDQGTQRFFNQRFRTWLSISPNDQIEVYMQVEVGHITWGENFEWPKTFNGPRFPASIDPSGDRVGAEIRRAFLNYHNERAGSFRVGILDWHDLFCEPNTMDSTRAVDDYDSFGSTLANSIWDFNVAGVSWAKDFHDTQLHAGWFVLWEGDASHASDDTHLFSFDADFFTTGDHSFGASLYYLNDNGFYSYPTISDYESSDDLWIGFHVRSKFGSVPIRGFLIYNTGERKEVAPASDFEHEGLAAKIEIPGWKLGAGALSIQAIHATGDDNPADNKSDEFRTIAQSERDNFGSQGYWSYLALTSPHGPSDVQDLGVGLQNRGLGLLTLQAKYDFPISNKLNGMVAAGLLKATENNPANGEKDMGTEVVAALNIDLAKSLHLNIGTAYLSTGDFYKENALSPDPDNLWEIFTRFQLEF